MTSTPLSDLLAPCFANKRPDAFRAFLHAFLDSRVGVIAAEPGSPVSLGLTRLADGTSAVLVSADPRTFRARFGGPFTGEMRGAAVARRVLESRGPQGIVINSARSVRSYFVSRAALMPYFEVEEPCNQFG
jgi:hypothetical protein